MGAHLASNLMPFAVTEAAGEPSLIGFFAYVALILAIVFGILTYAKKGLGERVFRNPLTACFEQLYLFIENMTLGVIGAHGRKYIPMIITFWLIIFFGNLVSLFLPFAPTADLSFNLGMAVVSIAYVQWEGMRANGVAGHFKHFAGPKLAGVMALLITPLIFVIEIISELMKNVSLSLRLYGNIHGGHLAVEAMNKVGLAAFFPAGTFVLLTLKLLTCVVQAMIFTMLTCVYISLVTHHSDDHHDGPQHGLETAHAVAG